VGARVTVCCVCHLSEVRDRAARWPHITYLEIQTPPHLQLSCYLLCSCSPACLLACSPLDPRDHSYPFHIRHTNHLDPLIPFLSLTAAREFNLLDQIGLPLPAGQGPEKSIGTTRCKPNRSENPRTKAPCDTTAWCPGANKEKSQS